MELLKTSTQLAATVTHKAVVMLYHLTTMHNALQQNSMVENEIYQGDDVTNDEEKLSENEAESNAISMQENDMYEGGNAVKSEYDLHRH